MAGADKIRERILEEARQQAQRNLKQAEVEAAAIIQEARNEAEVKKSETLEKARIEADERKKRMLAVAELEGRKMKLQAKQDMIDAAFAGALQRINSMPADQYEKLLGDLVVGLVSAGEYEIMLSDKDKLRLSSSFVDGITSRLNGKSINAVIKLSQRSANINSGFILKSGNIEINYSFEAIIKTQREQLESEVVGILFK